MTPAIAPPRVERSAFGKRHCLRRARTVQETPARYGFSGHSRVVAECAANVAERLPLRESARRLLLAEPPARGYKRKSPRGTPEKTLQDAWRRSAEREISLKASDGRWYRVAYAGRRGGSYGPDFVDAVLVRDDGARVTGDVEIHVRRDGWRAHGHDKDPRYNGVTFHAFLDKAGNGAAVTADNRAVKELRLGPLLGNRPRRKNRSKQATGPDVPVASPLPLPLDLSTAGEERFAARVSGAGLAMRHEGIDQALYGSVMECMGYPRNKRQFRELARRLPWAELTSWSAGGNVERIEVLLLWAGGFAGKPEGAGRLIGKTPTWTRPAGRPDNAPERRIKGLARLAARWSKKGGPARAMSEIVLGSDTPREVIRAFEVSGEGGTRSLIGRGRAAEIVVNAVLPGLCAAAKLHNDANLETRAVELYRRFPALPENSITREAKLVFARERGKQTSSYGAREQQGLIYLYRSLTTPVDMTRQLPLGATRLRTNR